MFLKEHISRPFSYVILIEMTDIRGSIYLDDDLFIIHTNTIKVDRVSFVMEL